MKALQEKMVETIAIRAANKTDYLIAGLSVQPAKSPCRSTWEQSRNNFPFCSLFWGTAWENPGRQRDQDNAQPSSVANIHKRSAKHHNGWRLGQVNSLFWSNIKQAINHE
jgi:hypothetical protein